MVKLSVFEKNQLKIANRTMKMTAAGARIMGGMTKPEAKIIKARLLRKRKAKTWKGR